LKRSDLNIIFVSALALRLACLLALFYMGILGITDDELMYRAPVELGSFWSAFSPERPPLYGVFVFIFGFGLNPEVALLTQVVLDSVTCILLSQTVFLVFQNRKVSLAAGWLAATNPLFIISSTLLLADSLFLFGFTLVLFLFARWLVAVGAKQLGLSLGLSLGLGLIAMTKTVGIYLAPIAFIVVLVVMVRKDQVSFASLCGFLLGAVLFFVVVSPQYIYNMAASDSVRFTAQTGTHLRYWVFPAIFQFSAKGTYAKGLELAAEADRTPGLDAFQSSDADTKIFFELIEDIEPAQIALGWVKGMLFNLIAPSTSISPIVRSLKNDSFYMSEGVGLLQKLMTFLSKQIGSLYFYAILLGVILHIYYLYIFGRGIFQSPQILRNKNSRYFVFFSCSIAFWSLFFSGPVLNPKYRILVELIILMIGSLYVGRVGSSARS